MKINIKKAKTNTLCKFICICFTVIVLLQLQLVVSYGSQIYNCADILKQYPDCVYAFTDLDNDNIDELIVEGNSSLLIYKYNNNSYNNIDSISINDYSTIYKTQNGIAIGHSMEDTNGWYYANYVLSGDKLVKEKTLASYEYGFNPDYKIYMVDEKNVDELTFKRKSYEMQSMPINFQTYSIYDGVNNWYDAYKNVIDQYNAVTKEFEANGKNNIDIDKLNDGRYKDVSIGYITDYGYGSEDMSYSLKDIDNNGIPELFIGSDINGSEYDIYDKYHLWSINTFKDGILVKFEEGMGYRWNCWLLDTNEIFESSSSGASNRDYNTYRLNDISFDLVNNISCDSYAIYNNSNFIDFLYSDGQEISAEQVDSMFNKKRESIVSLDWKPLYSFENETKPTAIKVILNNNELSFNQPPYIENNTTMVPMRAIFEALGASVNWDSNSQTITSTKGNTTILLTINSGTAVVNGKSISLASPAKLVNGNTMVPLRFVSESLGADVNWDGENKTISIYSA